MKYKYLKLALSVFLIQSCSNKYLDQTDIENINNAESTQNELNLDDKHIYQLVYALDSDRYIYSTYEVKDKHKFIQILFKNNEIYSISNISKYEAHWPKIRNCTLFPVHEDFDVNNCLTGFNVATINTNDSEWGKAILKIDENTKEKDKRETYGSVLMASTVAVLAWPLVLPAAAITTPIYLTKDSNPDTEEKTLKITLGSHVDDESINNIEKIYVSTHNNVGTVYYHGDPDFPSVGVAFGFINNKVTWIQRSPKGLCGGGFMFWGSKCVMGNHNDNHFK